MTHILLDCMSTRREVVSGNVVAPQRIVGLFSARYGRYVTLCE